VRELPLVINVFELQRRTSSLYREFVNTIGRIVRIVKLIHITTQEPWGIGNDIFVIGSDGQTVFIKR